MTNNDESPVPTHHSSPWRELLWLAPTISVTIFLIVLVVTIRDGDTVAAIIGIVLAVLGIALAYHFHHARSSDPKPVSDKPKPGFGWHILSYTTSVTLLALSLVRVVNDDNPARYFGDTVRVGINGELPGWSLATGSGYEGFDIELIKFLKEQYKIKNIEWVQLTQDERSHQWDGTLSTEPVQLVVSAFSITRGRLAKFHMAGPYYIDVSLALGNGDKPAVSRGEMLRSCAVKGTTGQNRLADVQKRLARDHQATMFVETPDKLSACYNQFFGDNDTKYIASDWSIIRVFNTAATITDAADIDQTPIVEVPEPDDVPMEPTGDEPRQVYGVALPPGHPNVCRDVTEKINSFLHDKWTDAYNSTLGSRGLSLQEWHKPAAADSRYCEN